MSLLDVKMKIAKVLMALVIVAVLSGIAWLVRWIIVGWD